MATSLTTGASDITDSLPVVKLLGKAAVTVLRPSTAVVDGKHRCCCAETGGATTTNRYTKALGADAIGVQHCSVRSTTEANDNLRLNEVDRGPQETHSAVSKPFLLCLLPEPRLASSTKLHW